MLARLPRADRRLGVLRAGVPSALRRAGLQPECGQGRRGRAARRPRLLHEPRLVPRPGAGRARRVRVRGLQPGGRRAERHVRLDAHRRARRSRPPAPKARSRSSSASSAPSPRGSTAPPSCCAAPPSPLRPEGRPLYSGLLSLGLPGTPMGDFWRLGDYLREFRGDSHTAAWVAFGIDATEIGLLTELFIGLPMRSYIRTRAWSDEELDAAVERLQSRGLLDKDGDGLHRRGARAARGHRARDRPLDGADDGRDSATTPTSCSRCSHRGASRCARRAATSAAGAADLTRTGERDPLTPTS